MKNSDCFEIKNGALKRYFGVEDCVKIPDTVTEIEAFAFFNNTEIRSIFIPRSVKLIDEYAFLGCEEIEMLVVEAGNPTYFSKSNCIIEKKTGSLFLACKNSVIPSDGSVKAISDHAFANCLFLTSVFIPSSVVSIGNLAFSGCEMLESIFIPSSVTSIGNFVFSGCENLKKIEVDENNPKYYSAENCIIDKDSKILVAGCNTSTIPMDKDIVFIGVGAFGDCTRLEKIKIPSSVKDIRDNAFSGCFRLRSVDIPEGVQFIGECAFEGCTCLIKIAIPDSVSYLSLNVFKNCDEDLVLLVHKDSVAEEYSETNGLRYKII